MPICDDSEERPNECEYDNFVRRKVELAQQQIAQGKYRSNDEVEAHFAARRAALRGEAH